jgi:hypothetical protein
MRPVLALAELVAPQSWKICSWNSLDTEPNHIQAQCNSGVSVTSAKRGEEPRLLHCTVSLCASEICICYQSNQACHLHLSTTTSTASLAGVRASPLLNLMALPSSPPVDRSSPSTNRTGDGQVSSTIYSSSDKSRIMSHGAAYVLVAQRFPDAQACTICLPMALQHTACVQIDSCRRTTRVL